MVGTYIVVLPPSPSAAEKVSMANSYAFTPKSIDMPEGLKKQHIRKVNKAYRDINAWISSVGAGIAMNDVDGDELANDLCITDPRTDQVVLTPVPDERGDRYEPFVLDPAPLPMDDLMAPMGCAAGDFNEDGRTDLVVYYWGRTPVIFQGRPGESALSAGSFEPIELMPGAGGATYTGPRWNSNAITIADFDGDGHEDIYIGNYFPDGPVLDPSKDGGVVMNDSLSNAKNGGEDHILRWTKDGFEPAEDVLPRDTRTGWTLGVSATDLDGDHLPELYIAHDFGTSRLLHNRSGPGDIGFTEVEGPRDPMVPKSKRVGGSSFKGMGVDFGDLDQDGLFDIFVSNITTSFGLQESNFAFMNTAGGTRDVRDSMSKGEAPYEDRSAPLGLAWSGWAWDVKMGDFDNDSQLEITQATGFVKGKRNRWAQLQELATANDGLLADPTWWPHVRPGDDLAGDQTMRFFAKGDDGRYANLSEELGLAVPVPTRGQAIGDANGDGRLDLAVAHQWGEPAFYLNESRDTGDFLGLKLTHPSGSPVVDAQVTVTLPDGTRRISRVDGGGGHSGKRSHDVHIGLGEQGDAPVQVRIRWRDRAGETRQQDLRLTPGWHALRLGSEVKER
ncbi:CRTAC1 family protein [Streptomyces sp. NPDC050433]|uniref:CRTAC1 family protein n=1 Tax=unclassified Streptomyces TaxID=2593676 RepID=UPI0034405AB4